MEEQDFSYIKDNIEEILKDIPQGITISAAAKTRTAAEVLAAVESGITVIGQNYVQEGEDVFSEVNEKAKLHLIGHLQRNKINKAIRIFDMIETIDSEAIASEISKKCVSIGKVMPVLIEVNSGREAQKNGVIPEQTESLIRSIAPLPGIKIKGLMTIGCYTENPENARAYYKETRDLFNKIKSLNIPNVEMEVLSMGMSDTYKVAIEEGANMVRIGSKIFGPRKTKRVS